MTSDEDNLTWQDRWEAAATAQRSEFEAMSPEELINFVKSGRIGGYYNVWYVIAAKCTLEQAGWLLIDVIERSKDDLARYHALAALGLMLGLPEGDERIHASIVREFPVTDEALNPVKTLLEEKTYKIL